MIENPDNIAEQVQNLNERVAKVSDNHLARIRELSNRIDEITPVSSRQILEIFYTLRTDAGSINGAYDCNGQTFHKDDFAGEQNPYELLVQGKAPTCSFAEYAEEVNAKGSCGKFGLDIVSKTFKVPTLTNILQPTVLASEIGKLVEAGIPNITGYIESRAHKTMNTAHGGSLNFAGGSFNFQIQGSPYHSSASGVEEYSTNNATSPLDYTTFDASRSSPLYKDNFNTVQPQTIYARAMVQLATATPELSIEQYTDKLDEYARAHSINGRVIGEIVQSIIPLADAGLHLLDGSTIARNGIYVQFCNYLADLQAKYPNLFVSESDWQSTNSTYGSCGKFVITESYVRLPNISDIVQGTTNLSAVGDLVEAGLPNITGRFWNVDTFAGTTGTLGAFAQIFTGNKGSYTGASQNSREYMEVALDASRSSPYYRDDIQKPTPQTIKSLLYICVATSVKTPVEVEIDSVMTDLNGKLDRDLSNVVGDAVERVVEQGESYIRYSSGKQECWGFVLGSTTSKYTISTPKPFINSDFNVQLTLSGTASYTNWTARYITLSTSSFEVITINNGTAGNASGLSWRAIGRWK